MRRKPLTGAHGETYQQMQDTFICMQTSTHLYQACQWTHMLGHTRTCAQAHSPTHTFTRTLEHRHFYPQQSTQAHACAAPTLSRPHAGVPWFTWFSWLLRPVCLPGPQTAISTSTPPGYLSYSSPYNSYSLQVSQPIRWKSSSNSGLTFTLWFRIRTTLHGGGLVKRRNNTTDFLVPTAIEKWGLVWSDVVVLVLSHSPQLQGLVKATHL